VESTRVGVIFDSSVVIAVERRGYTVRQTLQLFKAATLSHVPFPQVTV
jgi:hypothetical protein